MKNLFLTITAATLLTVSTFTSALPVIEGKIDIVGTASYSFIGPEVTVIHFDSAPIVNIATGSFSGIALGTEVTYPNPFVLASLPETIWAVGGFDFELAAILTNIVLSFGSTEFVSIEGKGTISHTDYEDTSGHWSYSAQSTPGGFNSGIFSFSSTTVPEPTTVALLGLALVGFGIARSKKQRK